MSKHVVHVGMLVLVVGLLLTTCGTGAWSMEVVSDQQMAALFGGILDGKCTEKDHCCTWGVYDYCDDAEEEPTTICGKSEGEGGKLQCDRDYCSPIRICCWVDPIILCCEHYPGYWYWDEGKQIYVCHCLDRDKYMESKTCEERAPGNCP